MQYLWQQKLNAEHDRHTSLTNTNEHHHADSTFYECLYMTFCQMANVITVKPLILATLNFGI